ncbi:hypothetical protein H6P81_019453 [Aristolochia fimbriata]|uniref:Uncharacterized protein n=1 Tax=Aristolochia fimbriata TaxID=158543 RepID=A0AAV7DSQ4_ARIFI|nr:hypothetical protein H6P81_019453 [Aristolochia fimbriata]
MKGGGYLSPSMPISGDSTFAQVCIYIYIYIYIYSSAQGCKPQTNSLKRETVPRHRKSWLPSPLFSPALALLPASPKKKLLLSSVWRRLRPWFSREPAGKAKEQIEMPRPIS